MQYDYVNEYLLTADVTPPVFLSCPSDIPVSPSKSTTANWKIPVAQDNSNEDPEVTLSLQITPPYTFTKDTVIVYTATDARGNAEIVLLSFYQKVGRKISVCILHLTVCGAFLP